MHTSSLSRRGIAALLTAGLLFTVATAQDQPIKTDSQYTVVERDPFVNQMGKTDVSEWTGGSQNRQPRSPDKIENLNEPLTDSPEVAAVDAPSVTVTGIVSVNGQRQAIINSSQGSRIIQVGQQLADYRVSKINEQGVTFSYSGQDFQVPLAAEF